MLTPKPNPASHATLPPWLQWTPVGRTLVFILAAASIWCLLAEMYHLCDMRTFFFWILIPATVALYAWAALDRAIGDGRLARAVMIGTVGGLIGAVAYDVFRLPFVYSHAWGLDALGVPAMPLYKVFPQFGAMILGQPQDQASYSLAAILLGWAYHFSNGATFGVMFAAMIGQVRRRFQGGWLWAVAMAVGIETGLLLSPYNQFFGIGLSTRFVVVTLTAHIIFGIGLGLYYAWHAGRAEHGGRSAAVAGSV